MKIPRALRRYGAYGIIGALTFGATFLAGSAGRKLLSVDALHLTARERDGYSPSYRVRSGRELAVIYIGSAGCAPSNQEDLPQVVETIKRSLSAGAAASGHSFTTMGIALDWSTKEGLEHLRKFGEFDEVSTGRKWVNEAAMKYIWQGHPGMDATPQVIVIERMLTVPSDSAVDRRYLIHGERLLARKVGTREIRRWSEHGAPLPHR